MAARRYLTNLPELEARRALATARHSRRLRPTYEVGALPRHERCPWTTIDFDGDVRERAVEAALTAAGSGVVVWPVDDRPWSAFGRGRPANKHHDQRALDAATRSRTPNATNLVARLTETAQ